MQFLVGSRFMRRVAGSAFVLVAMGISALSQTTDGPTRKPVATKIEKQILIFPDSVVTEQWPHTLKLVNPPQNLKLLNPGECIRVGIFAVGDDRDSLLEKTQLSFRVEFAGQVQERARAPFAGIKQLKPEGGDFVLQALAVANVEAPPLSMASMGASAGGWCVPDDAQEGTATIEAEIDSPSGHEKFAKLTIAIESFETGSKHAFKDEEEMERFTMGYHYQPNPARLYPELLIFCSDKKLNSNPDELMDQAALLSAALKGDPAAAKDFSARVAVRGGCPRSVGLLGLLMGGYDIAPALQSMNEDDRQMYQQRPELPDPYSFDSPAEIPAKFDMLWAIFCTTGQLAPIQKIASGLAWRSDWEEFDRARKLHTKFKEWTPSIGRAMAYSTAGWSIESFQQTDPLAADYIEFMIASPDTPDAVKTELKGLSTNPAFKREGDK
ncbi:MAG: hypothetical protein ABSD70_20445 [Terracidiphilus sp.]